jgi:hypothetical protein
MEVRMVQVDNEKAPINGCAMYIIVEERNRYVTLLHPIHLERFDITVDEYQSGAREKLWPFNETKMKFDAGVIAELMERTMKKYSSREKPRQYPASLVRRCIAELRGCEIDEVATYKETVKSKTGYAVRSEKRPGVVDAICDMLHKGVTIDECVKELVKMFPGRSGDGMKTTVRCQINRLPKREGLAMQKIEDKKRGLIFKFKGGKG